MTELSSGANPYRASAAGAPRSAAGGATVPQFEVIMAIFLEYSLCCGAAGAAAAGDCSAPERFLAALLCAVLCCALCAGLFGGVTCRRSR